MAVSQTEQYVLNHLIGQAMLNERLCHDLIDPTKRRTLLDRLPLSGGTKASLLALPDDCRIEEFAEGIYTQLFLP
jgi:hypothetical protein